MKSADDSEWTINNKALEILDNDPQRLFQCTESSDRVVFDLTGEHKFKRTLEIFHPLEFFTESSEGKQVGNGAADILIFTCPDTGPFLRIKFARLEVYSLVYTPNLCSDLMDLTPVDLLYRIVPTPPEKPLSLSNQNRLSYLSALNSSTTKDVQSSWTQKQTLRWRTVSLMAMAFGTMMEVPFLL